MRTVEIKERPDLKGKTVGDKCSVEIDGVISKVEKHCDYDNTNGPQEVSNKKQPEYVFYTIEFDDSDADVEYTGKDEMEGKIKKIVDKSEPDEVKISNMSRG